MSKRAILVLLFCMASVGHAQFIVYREFKYLGQPDNAYFDSLGFKRSDGVYENEVTGGTPPVKEHLMRSKARSTRANYVLYQDRMWFDIEYLSTDSFRVGRAQALANAETLAKYIGWAKDEEPTLQIGMYGMVPVTDLYMSNRLAQRRSANDLLQVLADSLDFICPSIYLYYGEDRKPYASYAVPMVAEAKRLAKGKKVFPFISPGYHPAGDHVDQNATKAVFANVLKTIKEAGADGVIVFGGNGSMGDQPGDWASNDTAGWWAATKEFMAALAADPGPTPTPAPTIIDPEKGAQGQAISFTARWFAVLGAQRYHLQIADNASFENPEIDDSTMTDTLRQVTLDRASTRYFARLRARTATLWTPFSLTVDFHTADLNSSNGGERHVCPLDYSLSQNFPNPFNPTTTIRFSLPVTCPVDVTLFGAQGESICTLVNRRLDAGYHEINLKADGLASGTYYCRIRAGKFTATKKLTLLK